MEVEKVRAYSDDELKAQVAQAGEQLFRLRFQTALGNNDGVKKIRGLRRDIARMKTIARQRALGVDHAAAPKRVKVAAGADDAAEEKVAKPAKKKAASAAKVSKVKKGAKVAKKAAPKKKAKKG